MRTHSQAAQEHITSCHYETENGVEEADYSKMYVSESAISNEDYWLSPGDDNHKHNTKNFRFLPFKLIWSIQGY